MAQAGHEMQNDQMVQNFKQWRNFAKINENRDFFYKKWIFEK